MKEMIIFVLILLCGASRGGESVLAELRELYRIRRSWDPAKMSGEAHRQRMDVIKNRVEPVVQKEFSGIAEGKVSPVARELLSDPEAMEYCRTVLIGVLRNFPSAGQVEGMNAIFSASPESERGTLILSFLQHLPRASFHGEDIQKWIVDKINAGMPAGALYFILSKESACAVFEMSRRNMKSFAKKNENDDRNLNALLSAVFLASNGDEDALAFLESLLENRDINSLLDRTYTIHAAAMSGNFRLIHRILRIAASDATSHWNGEDCVPRKTSFAHIAANACSLSIEGFPVVGFWQEYDESTEAKVRDWIKQHPSWTTKMCPIVFFRESPFSSTITKLRQFLRRK